MKIQFPCEGVSHSQLGTIHIKFSTCYLGLHAPCGDNASPGTALPCGCLSLGDLSSCLEESTADTSDWKGLVYISMRTGPLP